MEVLSLHPGVGLARVRQATGFELAVRDPLADTPPPSDAELHILRTEARSASLRDRPVSAPFHRASHGRAQVRLCRLYAPESVRQR